MTFCNRKTFPPRRKYPVANVCRVQTYSGGIERALLPSEAWRPQQSLSLSKSSTAGSVSADVVGSSGTMKRSFEGAQRPARGHIVNGLRFSRKGKLLLGVRNVNSVTLNRRHQLIVNLLKRRATHFHLPRPLLDFARL